MPAPMNPETGQAYPSLSTRDVQKALTVAHAQNGNIPGPGAIDNQWGSHTEASFQAWASEQPPGVDAGLVARPAQRADTIYLFESGRAVLYTLARIYDAQGYSTQQSQVPVARPTTAPAFPAPDTGWLGISWWIWALIGLGVVGVGGGLVYYYTKHRRRR